MDRSTKKNEVWFQTNLDFEETRDRLLPNSELIKGDMQDTKGRLTFRIMGFDGYTFQVTKGGKLGIYYPDGCSYEKALEKLKPFLVTSEGTQAEIYDIIKETEGVPWITPYVNLPENFRLYREIFEDLVRILSRKGPNLERYLNEWCKCCARNLKRPPALPNLCKNCHGSLYNIVLHKMTRYFPKKVPKSAINIFLIYEYKAQILILACNEIRRAYEELNDEDFGIFFESLWQRVRKLHDFDASLEPKIPEYVFHALPIAPPQDAEKAIRLAIEAVKWHVIGEDSMKPEVRKSSLAYYKFMDEGMRIINKAYCSPLIKDFNRKIKRAFHILRKKELAREKFRF